MNTSQTTPPRQGSVTLGGHPWLARMLDKARLDAAATIDAFDLVYPCPMDKQLLSKLNVSAETFQRIAVANTTDDAVLQALAKEGVALA